MLEFRILGPLEVVADDGRRVQLGGPRQRATLALLLLSANRVVSIERLADALYAGRPPVTAVTQVQRQVSDLRKLLGEDAIETRPPGYVVRLAEPQLDLARFERLSADGVRAGNADLLVEALDLWRGPPLADLEYEPFVRAVAGRLEELRLAALEERMRLDLERGRHAQVAAELETLVAQHPLRERLRALQMLAHYRSGRQADALAAYRDARRTLVEEVGLEPSHELQELQRAILGQDASLAARDARTVLVAATAGDAGALLAVGAALSGVELVCVRLVEDEADVEPAARSLLARRPPNARTAAFTTRDAAADILRLAASSDAELVLLDATDDRVFDGASATVGVLAAGMPRLDDGLAIPFGGGEHDWAALELAAQLARGPITLVGTRAQQARRDASRLLADAALALQRVTDVEAVPMLADELVPAVADAGLVVVGVSPRWRTEGIGESREELVAAGIPVLLVHRGPRPGALAPRDARTAFSWSLGSG